MARRTVLTSRQRSALFALPQREADLLRHYTLSDEDLQNIGAPAARPHKDRPLQAQDARRLRRAGRESLSHGREGDRGGDGRDQLGARRISWGLELPTRSPVKLATLYRSLSLGHRRGDAPCPLPAARRRAANLRMLCIMGIATAEGAGLAAERRPPKPR